MAIQGHCVTPGIEPAGSITPLSSSFSSLIMVVGASASTASPTPAANVRDRGALSRVRAQAPSVLAPQSPKAQVEAAEKTIRQNTSSRQPTARPLQRQPHSTLNLRPTCSPRIESACEACRPCTIDTSDEPLRMTSTRLHVVGINYM